MKFTDEQQKVIDLRERNLLVSAAAGSGKTAVLVERILSMITNTAHSVDIDQLLIVTFTKAAAAEMRERIGAAIEKKLVESPANIHLQRQQTLLHHAQITTIDSFCLNVIRNYFHKIDLEPDFRVGEEGELKLLKQDVLDAVLEDYYRENSAEFYRLAESLATGKSDEKLKSTILTLYEFAMSDPWPIQWLNQCVTLYEPIETEAFQKQPVYQAWMEYLKNVTEEWIRMMEICVCLSEEEDGPSAYQPVLSRELEMLKQLDGIGTYEAYADVLERISFGRLPAIRKFTGDERKKESVMQMRNEIKDSRKKMLDQFFFLPCEEMLANVQKNHTVVQTLIQVTIDFITAFTAKKREKNMLDFHDMEHLALEILVDAGTKEPTQTAKEMREEFAEIMIDEYQDSNFVQEALLTAITRGNNLFMVGDVKQSIYRFRMARPELFMGKYDTYTREESENQKIDLHMNFRSRREVLETVNDVFFQIMHRDLGNVEYDQQAALYPGMEFLNSNQEGMFKTEILIADSKDFQEDPEETEAQIIAQRIQKLIKEQMVTDKHTGLLRQAEYRDIVILLRGLSSFGIKLVEVLKEYGILARTSAGTGYFSALEVQVVLNYLRILDNPRQDIPMVSVLKSPIGGITEEELAKIRIQFPEGTFYQSVFFYADEGSDVKLKEKLSAFLKQLFDFRERILDTTIHELLYQVMDETGYMDYVHALPAGQIRRANLEMLLEKAIAFEKTSYHGLFQFVRYINQLQKYQVDFGEAIDETDENVVRIMTIHKSKGLEFPIVIAAGMGKQFNQQDIRNQMVLHPQYGIGLDLIDPKKRIRIPTLSRQILARQIQIENAGEELRVLYVALTRAREKLILTGMVKNAEETTEEYESTDQIGFWSRIKAGCYFDWILPVLSKKGYLIQRIMPEMLLQSQIVEQVSQKVSRQVLLELSEQIGKEQVEEISNKLSFRYAYEKEEKLKAKLSVSELKHRAIDRLRQEENDGTYWYEEPKVIPYIPEFVSGDKCGEEKETANMGGTFGTAMHRVLECFDFTKDFDTLPEQVKTMCEMGLLEESQKELITEKDIRMFFETDLALRMQQAARNGRLQKEKPFVMGISAGEADENCDSEAMILVQGMIDAFFEEEGQIVLVDYKTDAVENPEELQKRYQAQMDLYQEALQKTLDKRVKEKILYSFR